MTETAGFTAGGLFGSPAAAAAVSAGSSALIAPSTSIATKTPAAAKGGARNKPQPRTIARNDLDAGDDATGNDDDGDDDDAPSLKLHSHRQNHTPSKLPAVRSASRQGTSAASLSPPQPSRQHPQPPAFPPSPDSPKPVPQQGLATPSRAVKDDDRDDEAAPEQHPPPHHHRLSADANDSPPRPSPRSRASTTPATSASATTSTDSDRPASTKRPSSCPEATAFDAHLSSLSRTDPARSQARRAPASRSSHGVSTTAGPPPSLTTQRRHVVEVQPPSATPTTEWTSQGQRELLLPKRLSQSSSSDESRHSPSYRPPVSYKPPATSSSAQLGASTPVRVPPIRGFRSSGSRKSLALDMNFQPRPYDLGEDYPDTTNDRTLRALEGRYADDALQMTGSGPGGRRGPGADDAGDVFLRIAREEPTRRLGGDSTPDDAQSSVSRANRSSHRRPLSTAVATYHTTSPPRLSRRLSDQQDRPRLRNVEDDQASEVSRATTYRSLARDKAASVHPGDDATRTRTGSSTLRPSPLTPRSHVHQEPSPENSIYARRRASITDSSLTVAGRSSTYKASGMGPSHNKAYNSSPLVRSFDFQNRPASELAHRVEGTESTASTTAPSTVWDELDDIKSRIHRLELTGKMPSTSGAAVSRLSDERPATATTTVTTMSLSPKRQGQPAEATSATPPQREVHPLLHAALAKSKPFMSPEVYRALESVANDAIGLSAMMGAPGQPGPISSGASTIGSGNNMTDRQLRRKADGVCRSLTELCVALGEDAAAQPRSVQPTQSTFPQLDGPVAPTIPKSHSGLPAPRRASIAVEQTLPKSNSSPRALSKFEERRNHLLNGTAFPTPRASGSNASTPGDPSMNRRSSLMIPRTRRAVTEEPEDDRNSSLLRTRRAGTEEPDEGRITSLLVRNRRGTVGEEGDESRFRAPSRANTEVNTIRGQGRDYAQEAQMPPSDGRRRLVSTSLHTSRLAAPSASSPAPPRRYLERSTPDRDATANRLVEEYGSRLPPLSPGMAHARANSLSARRQNRDSMITVATAGVYR
ncbi:Uncharacterized protein TCAP_02382 [Tolypocladium capitatum]|uniref:Uncharacterized protein n=1 Tax=Tolypocladium capitatum TaxID=45235 RepID=A0A2K3QJG5_9HYPO|nr:Uncharacterized protein TCAP_02382 [Tolypocladium capitatum]